MEGKAMNDTVTSSLIMVLLCVLRCLVPVGILFGISYLLQRSERVIEHSAETLADEKEKDVTMKTTAPEATEKNSTENSASSNKKKSATSNKKES